MQEGIGLSASEQYMHTFLAEWKLEQYASSLCKLGYDDLDYLQGKDQQYLSKIARSVDMPVGHEERFIDAIQQVYLRALPVIFQAHACEK